MTETTSKIVLGIEALVLVLPVGGLLVIFVPSIFADVLTFGNTEGMIIAILSTVPFLAGISLMFGFWMHGAEGVRNRPYAWIAAFMGAAVVTSATIFTAIAVFVPELRRIAEMTSLFMFGLPLLIPLMHLFLESAHRRPPVGASEAA